MIPREDILGIGISAINMDTAVGTIARWIEMADRQYICVTGVHGVMESRRSDAIRDAHNAAGMVTPDGMPLVWLLRCAGFSHVTRVCGPELIPAVFAAPQLRKARHFFYGTTERTLRSLERALRTRFPHAQIVGSIAPPFRQLSEIEDERYIREINNASPDIVWVGLSTPKQELWMSEHRDRLGASVLIGVGAAFDIHAGNMRQAPRFLRRCGLEWGFRLCTEPRRLWRRYLRNNPRFIYEIVANKVWLGRNRINDKDIVSGRGA